MTLRREADHPEEAISTIFGRSGTVLTVQELPFRVFPASPQLPLAGSYSWWERRGGGFIVDAIYRDHRPTERFIAMPTIG